MKFGTSIILFALICLCLSCNKNSNSTNAQQLVYFDYAYALPTTGMIGHANFVDKRVCYDVGSGQTVWEQENTKYPGMYDMITYGFGSSLNYYDLDVQNPYLFNKLVNNTLIRVFADQDYPMFYISPLTATAYNGVYFQKIDAATGNEISIKTLIPKTDFNPTNPFCISKVESDDSRLYFTCNNGFLYAFDFNGNLVWKRNLVKFPLFKPVTTNNDYPYSMFGLNNGKIYIQSYSSPGTGYPDFKIIDATSGNVLYDEPSYSSGSFSLEKYPCYLFTDQYAFACSYYGVSGIDKVTGLPPFPFVSSSYSGNSNYNTWRNPQPIGVSNNQVVIVDYDQKLAFFDLTRNQFGASTIDCSSIHGGVISSNVLYGGFCNATDRKFEFSAVNINAGNGVVIWKNSYTMEGAIIGQKLSKFIVSGDNIYLFVNFHIENGICKVNPVVSGNMESHSIIVLRASDGSIVKQCLNVPGVGYWYNIVK